MQKLRRRAELATFLAALTRTTTYKYFRRLLHSHRRPEKSSDTHRAAAITTGRNWPACNPRRDSLPLPPSSARLHEHCNRAGLRRCNASSRRRGSFICIDFLPVPGAFARWDGDGAVLESLPSGRLVITGVAPKSLGPLDRLAFPRPALMPRNNNEARARTKWFSSRAPTFAGGGSLEEETLPARFSSRRRSGVLLFFLPRRVGARPVVLRRHCVYLPSRGAHRSAQCNEGRKIGSDNREEKDGEGFL